RARRIARTADAGSATALPRPATSARRACACPRRRRPSSPAATSPRTGAPVLSVRELRGISRALNVTSRVASLSAGGAGVESWSDGFAPRPAPDRRFPTGMRLAGGLTEEDPMSAVPKIVLEPAAQEVADAFSKPPFLYQLDYTQAPKVLDDAQEA